MYKIILATAIAAFFNFSMSAQTCGSVNVAQNAGVSFFSSNSTGPSASLAFDNNTGTSWISDAAAYPSVGIIMGGNHDLCSIYMKWAAGKAPTSISLTATAAGDWGGWKSVLADPGVWAVTSNEFSIDIPVQTFSYAMFQIVINGSAAAGQYELIECKLIERGSNTGGGGTTGTTWATTGTNDIKSVNTGIVYINGVPSQTRANAANMRLSVNGDVYTQRLVVTSLQWSDYVFDPSYRLRPLTEVAAFIQKNKHLPEVPSSADIEKNGADVGNNQSVLLKKIEELTLYIIDQNRKQEEQQKMINQQAKQLQQMKAAIDKLTKRKLQSYN